LAVSAVFVLGASASCDQSTVSPTSRLPWDSCLPWSVEGLFPMVGRRSCYTRGERTTVRNYGLSNCSVVRFCLALFSRKPEVGCRLPIRQADELLSVAVRFGVRFGSIPTRHPTGSRCSDVLLVCCRCSGASSLFGCCSCSALLPRTSRTVPHEVHGTRPR